jgi:glutamate synthase (NADPH/NADH) small chain
MQEPVDNELIEKSTVAHNLKRSLGRPVEMAKQDPKKRIYNFKEVALGYTEEEAVAEASRCLACAKPQCVEGCPVGVDIPAFIRLIKERRFAEAVAKVKEKNCLPAVCGRVCPQETQCQQACILTKKCIPVEIGRLERFVGDIELQKGLHTPQPAPPTGKKVAIIGAGPAGLTTAADLAQLGHKVVIFEALHTAGGVLVYGIPEFRLPKKIVQAEVDYIKKLGVELRTDVMVGKLFSIEELQKEYDAVFIGTGAGLPQFLGIPGENLCGIYSANEFLIRVNLMKSYNFPKYDTPVKVGKRVAVVGGGNVAMDAARSARRMGAEKVTVIYRRSRQELPARHEEYENAVEEGIEFEFLATPSKFIGDEQGWVKGIELLSMQLGDPDSSGRRRPVPVPGSETVMDVETVIVAIGRTPNPIIQSETRGLETTKQGTIAADKETGRTSIIGVYTGGDIMTGEATVISAMNSGKKAAKAIHNYLVNK